MSDAANPGMMECPYYRGTGTCGGQASCGYRGEPVCINDEPERGWDGKGGRMGARS